MSTDFSPVQTKTATSKSSDSLTITFDSTGTSGNLLVAGYSRSNDVEFGTPSGWNKVDFNRFVGGHNSGLYWRVSDGTETAVTWNAAPFTGNNTGVFAEYEVQNVTSVTSSAKNTGSSSSAGFDFITDDTFKFGIGMTDGMETLDSVTQSHVIDIQGNTLITCGLISGDEGDGVTPVATLSASNDWGTIYCSVDGDAAGGGLEILRRRMEGV